MKQIIITIIFIAWSVFRARQKAMRAQREKAAAPANSARSAQPGAPSRANARIGEIFGDSSASRTPMSGGPVHDDTLSTVALAAGPIGSSASEADAARLMALRASTAQAAGEELGAYVVPPAPTLSLTPMLTSAVSPVPPTKLSSAGLATSTTDVDMSSGSSLSSADDDALTLRREALLAQAEDAYTEKRDVKMAISFDKESLRTFFVTREVLGAPRSRKPFRAASLRAGLRARD